MDGFVFVRWFFISFVSGLVCSVLFWFVFCFVWAFFVGFCFVLFLVFFSHRAVFQVSCWPSCWSLDHAGGAVWTVPWLLSGPLQ